MQEIHNFATTGMMGKLVHDRYLMILQALKYLGPVSILPISSFVVAQLRQFAMSKNIIPAVQLSGVLPSDYMADRGTGRCVSSAFIDLSATGTLHHRASDHVPMTRSTPSQPR